MQVMRRTGTPLRYAPVNAFTAVLFLTLITERLFLLDLTQTEVYEKAHRWSAAAVHTQVASFSKARGTACQVRHDKGGIPNRGKHIQMWI
jgi:hypothetical protein